MAGAARHAQSRAAPALPALGPRRADGGASCSRARRPATTPPPHRPAGDDHSSGDGVIGLSLASALARGRASRVTSGPHHAGHAASGAGPGGDRPHVGSVHGLPRGHDSCHAQSLGLSHRHGASVARPQYRQWPRSVAVAALRHRDRLADAHTSRPAAGGPCKRGQTAADARAPASPSGGGLGSRGGRRVALDLQAVQAPGQTVPARGGRSSQQPAPAGLAPETSERTTREPARAPPHRDAHSCASGATGGPPSVSLGVKSASYRAARPSTSGPTAGARRAIKSA
jgi:hypothetical protein